MTIFLGILTTISFIHESGYFYYLFATIGLLLITITFTNILKWPQKVWMGLAVILGSIISRVILIILYYLIVTPIGLLQKNKLELKICKNKASYWNIRRNSNKKNAEYEKQY